jgi:hypothetical protein
MALTVRQRAELTNLRAENRKLRIERDVLFRSCAKLAEEVKDPEPPSLTTEDEQVAAWVRGLS